MYNGRIPCFKKCHLSAICLWLGMDLNGVTISYSVFKHLVWLESLALYSLTHLMCCFQSHFSNYSLYSLCDLDPLRMHTMMRIFFSPVFFCSLASITTFCAGAGIIIQLYVLEVDKVINVKEENGPVKFPMCCNQLRPFCLIPEAMLMFFLSLGG